MKVKRNIDFKVQEDRTGRNARNNEGNPMQNNTEKTADNYCWRNYDGHNSQKNT